MQLIDSQLRQCWFLAGPTASGKSAAAIELADRIGAEVISLDSMAIYRGMDIGTAKPSAAERSRVPHHLIDIADPHQDFSVAEFVERAAAAVNEILSRGRVPLLTGGTGLYLRSVLRGLCEVPSADWALRRELKSHAEAEGPASLHARLHAVDPVTAARLHPSDVRRVIRALEVYATTGRPLSAGQTQQPRPADAQPVCVVWLSPPRPWLRQRISERIDAMLNAGWLDEARILLHRDPPPGRTAMQALGYRELFAHLRGELTLDAAVPIIRTATQQFAKRQHTWFRNLPECQELAIRGDESSTELASRIEAHASAREAQRAG
jgi:tRNA dimethylallyltransferase